MYDIVVNFRPFTLKQKIMIYKNGVYIRQINAPVDKISDVIYGLRNQCEIDSINLCGNADYLSKFKAELNLKFSNNTEINIINR